MHDVVQAGGALRAAAEEGERKVAERMAKITGRESKQPSEPDLGESATRTVPRAPDPTNAASDDPEEAFLKSTTPLPRSLYGRLNQLTDLPGFPASPPLVLSNHEPKAYMFRNFLTPHECEHLMQLAKKQLAPSTVVGDKGSGSMVSKIRTSAGCSSVGGRTQPSEPSRSASPRRRGCPNPTARVYRS